MSKIINGVEYTTFKDMWKDATSLTQEEKEEIKLKISLAGKFIEARDKSKIKITPKNRGREQAAIATRNNRLFRGWRCGM